MALLTEVLILVKTLFKLSYDSPLLENWNGSATLLVNSNPIIRHLLNYRILTSKVCIALGNALGKWEMLQRCINVSTTWDTSLGPRFKVSRVCE